MSERRPLSTKAEMVCATSLLPIGFYYVLEILGYFGVIPQPEGGTFGHGVAHVE